MTTYGAMIALGMGLLAVGLFGVLGARPGAPVLGVQVLAVALGGALGSMLRFGVGLALQPWTGKVFPVATLSVNVLGALFMGFLFTLFFDKLELSPALRAGVLTGFLGGLTTFSTFAMETVRLVEDGASIRALAYVLTSVLMGVAAAFLGVVLARSL